MVVKGGGYTVNLEEPTQNDIKTTTEKNVAGLRLEDTPVIIGDCGIINPDGLSDSDIRDIEQYQAALTDPRRI
jgi:hypothetical protein